MTGVVFALQLIGWILLALLVLMIVLLLIVLFVPIRYEGRFEVRDPEPHDEAAWGELRDRSSFHLSISWLGALIKGMLTYDGELSTDLRIAWVHVDPGSAGQGSKGKRDHKETADETTQRSVRDRLTRLYRKADYYRRILRKEETSYTLTRCRQILVRTLRRLLPQRWQIAATVGLGDPAATANVLEAHGILYPFTAGHVELTPVFQQFQMDVSGEFKGRIRLLHIVVAVLQIAMDRRIRMTIRRLRNADRNIERHYQRMAAAAAEHPESA